VLVGQYIKGLAGLADDHARAEAFGLVFAFGSAALFARAFPVLGIAEKEPGKPVLLVVLHGFRLDHVEGDDGRQDGGSDATVRLLHALEERQRVGRYRRGGSGIGIRSEGRTRFSGTEKHHERERCHGTEADECESSYFFGHKFHTFLRIKMNWIIYIYSNNKKVDLVTKGIILLRDSAR